MEASIKEKELERMLKALANRRRLAVLAFLKRKDEASVGGIAAAIKLSLKSTSRHLAVLFSADLVEREQRGLEVYYRQADAYPPPVKGIITIL